MLVDVVTGAEIASSEMAYPHAVMDEALPSGKKLGVDWALQHPQDYLDVLYHIVPDVLKQGGVAAADVIGVGVDFTSCTVLPVKKDGTPLCFLPEYADEPNAYVKLWKHHAAQDKANIITETAENAGKNGWTGMAGKFRRNGCSRKSGQILDESPEVYAAMDRFIEAADWLVWQLTGKETRNPCTAGYKALWHKQEGYPFQGIFCGTRSAAGERGGGKTGNGHPALGSRAGGITPEIAEKRDLPPGLRSLSAMWTRMYAFPR